jgi:hypothetical protein
MENQTKQQFRDDEIVILRHWNKERQEYVSNVYPKVGGRLRLAHENNDAINIETEIYRYDENLAVVIATVKTMSGQFTGIGMSSVERDKKIAPAILELAETRGIARALRFAGFGVEYCSAEEVSHLENGSNTGQKPFEAPKERPAMNRSSIEVDFEPVEGCAQVYKPQFKVQDNAVPPAGQNTGNGNSNGNGGSKNRQLSVKQYEYIKSLGKKSGYDYAKLTKKCIELFGVKIEALNTAEASNFIDNLQTGVLPPETETSPQHVNA